jgi:hypothetical protein
VLAQIEQPASTTGRVRVLCSRVRCVCGTEKVLTNNYLRSGHSSGCGCRRGRKLAASGITHGRSQTPLYRLWATVKARLKRDPAYAHVRMHEPWVHDFVAFATFIESLGPKPTPEHTLDRIEPAGHYEPGNLRWADKTTQSLNRRNAMVTNLLANALVKVGQKYDMLTVLDVFVIKRHGRNWYGAKVQCDCGTVKTIYQKQLLSPKTKSCGCFKNRNLRLAHKALEKPITANGRTMSMSAWARETGISKHVIWNRINVCGWDPARAVTTPLQETLIDLDGESMTGAEWSKRHGIPVRVIWKRLRGGWDPFQAVTTPVRFWGRNRT